MNDFVDSFVYWLADFYLATTILLALSIAAIAACTQPAWRLAVTKAAIVASALLVALCAIPGWSIVSLGGIDATELARQSPVSRSPVDAHTPIETARLIPAFPPTAITQMQPPPAPLAVTTDLQVPWRMILIVIYLVGSTAVVIWLAAGAVAAQRFVQRAEDPPAELLGLLPSDAEIARLQVSPEIAVPVALGVWRPRVLLPRDWIASFSTSELTTVLAHEAAHIRYGDLQWLAASRMLLIALWAHPLYWWLRGQMRLDQETLADAAAAEVAGRQAYAEQLVAWAREVVPRRRPLLPASVGLWEGASQLRSRVAVLLDERYQVLRESSGGIRRTALVTFGILTLVLSAFTFQPTLNAADEVSLPDHFVEGDRYVLCRVTTDLQRSLLGDAGKPNTDVSAYMQVNAARFAEESLEPDSPTLMELSNRLEKWAEADNRWLAVNVYVAPSSDQETYAECRAFAETLSRHLENLGRAAGYKRVSASQTYAGDFDWNQLIQNAESLAQPVAAQDEQAVGNLRVKVFAAESFLSRLLTTADCVVNIVPVIDGSNANDFPTEFQDEVSRFLRQLGHDRSEVMLLRVRCTDAADDRLSKWVDDRALRGKFASDNGFKSCNLQRSYVAESDAGPLREDIRGRVELPDGNPAVGIQVTAFSMSDPTNFSKPYGYQRTTTDTEGRFQLSIYSGGKEVFWILPRDYVQQTHVINERRGDLGTFQLTTGLYFHGRVADHDAKPISNVWVNAELIDGPAKQNIEMPVADSVERAGLTDDQGNFHLGPLPVGTYRVVPDEMPADDFRNLDESRRSLPAAFLPQRIELTAVSELEEIEIKPIDSVKIVVKFLDSGGNPSDGFGFFLIGTGPDGRRVALRRGPVRREQSQQVVSFDAPKGLTKTVIDFPRSSIRVRRSPSDPWENDFSLDLGTLDRDWLKIEVVRYRTPTLDVTARDESGDAIADFKPAIFYHSRDQLEPRQGRWIGDVRGDVNFEPRQGGGWQSEHLLPDEEFTLTVSADGYQPFEVQQSVAEGRRQEVKAVLRPLVTTSDASAADEQKLVAADELAGIVQDEAGKPLAGVTVDAWTWFPGNETTSDANGRFRLKGLDKHESVELQFTQAGFCPRLFVAEPVGKPNWVVTLNSRTYLEGRVLDPKGQPVAGMNLRATRGPFETAGAVWTETETDSDGRYRIYLEPDTYELRVRRPGVGVARYETVVVNENDRRNFDLQLESGPTFRARVIDSVTREPVGGIRLFRWREPEIVGSSNEQGELEIENMLPGRYEFNVSADQEKSRFPHIAGDYARWWSPEALNEWQRLDPTDRGVGFQRNFDGLEFDIREGMEPVAIVVERGVTVRGQVVDPDGKPVAGATVAPAKTGSGNSLTGDTRYSVQTDTKGNFEVRLPASGDVKYNLVAHDGKFQEWRRWANGVGELLQTKPGDEVENVTLELSRPCIVRGLVLNAGGKPVANHAVRAHAADKMENRYYDPTTKTDEQGRFALVFVRPGKHYIQADPFWLVAEEGPRDGWRLVEATPEQPVDDVVLKLEGEPTPRGSLNVLQQQLKEKAVKD